MLEAQRARPRHVALRRAEPQPGGGRSGRGGARQAGRLTAVARPGDGQARARAHTMCSARPSSWTSSTMDVVLMRQDPPFDLAYITATHMLEHIHPKTLVVNDPANVRNAPEKLLVTHFPDLMPPTLITWDVQAIRDVPGRAPGHHRQAVVRGRRGGCVPHSPRRREPGLAAGDALVPLSRAADDPALRAGGAPRGDKRVILIDGEPVGGVNRVPADGRGAVQHACRWPAGGGRSDGA